MKKFKILLSVYLRAATALKSLAHVDMAESTRADDLAGRGRISRGVRLFVLRNLHIGPEVGCREQEPHFGPICKRLVCIFTECRSRTVVATCRGAFDGRGLASGRVAVVGAVAARL